MTDTEKAAAKGVKVVMAVASHNLARGAEVTVDKKTAERLIANSQARPA